MRIAFLLICAAVLLNQCSLPIRPGMKPSNAQGLTVGSAPQTNSFDVTLVDLAIPGGQGLVQRVQIDPAKAVEFSVVGNDVPFTLRDPQGRRISATSAYTDTQYTVESEGFGLTAQRYTVQNPAAGAWQVILQPSTAAQASLYVSTTAPALAQLETDKAAYDLNQPIRMVASITRPVGLLTNAVVTGTLSYPDATEQVVAFHDDGANGDDAAADGRYTAVVNSGATEGRILGTVDAVGGNVQRTTVVSIDVRPVVAVIDELGTITLPDANGNGLFDEIALPVQMTNKVSGDFTLHATLVDANGDLVTTGSYGSMFDGAPLPAATHVITLTFDGETIRERGENGPYRIQDLTLSYQHDGRNFDLEQRENVATTDAYTARQFEGPMVEITGYHEQPRDTDGNGLFNTLTITADLVLVRPGEYQWYGTLHNSKFEQVGTAEGEGVLSDTASIPLNFDGIEINSKKVDGPYELTVIAIRRSDGSGIGITDISPEYSTAAYKASDFEPQKLTIISTEQAKAKTFSVVKNAR